MECTPIDCFVNQLPAKQPLIKTPPLVKHTRQANGLNNPQRVTGVHPSSTLRQPTKTSEMRLLWMMSHQGVKGGQAFEIAFYLVNHDAIY